MIVCFDNMDVVQLKEKWSEMGVGYAKFKKIVSGNIVGGAYSEYYYSETILCIM